MNSPEEPSPGSTARHTEALSHKAATSTKTSSPKKTRKRVFYLDLVRALATCMIVLVHFNNPYLQPSSYLLTQQPFGIYLGGLGVSLFLIISGAALALTYHRPYSLKTFYWKRFKGIYPPFWIAWIIGTLFFIVMRHGSPINACSLSSFPATVLGFDGILATYHIPNCYLLGEWFLGLIISFYLVFPVLLWAIDRFPKVSAVLIVSIWLAFTVLGSRAGLNPITVFLPAHLVELCFGIYFIKYVKRVPWWMAIPALGMLAFSSYFHEINEDIIIPFVGIAAFVLLVQLARFVDYKPIRTAVNLISKYSYEIFLVHHVVIIAAYAVFPVNTFSGPYAGMIARAFLCFICITTFVLAIGLSRLTRVCVALVSRIFNPQRARR